MERIEKQNAVLLLRLSRSTDVDLTDKGTKEIVERFMKEWWNDLNEEIIRKSAEALESATEQLPGKVNYRASGRRREKGEIT